MLCSPPNPPYSEMPLILYKCYHVHSQVLSFLPFQVQKQVSPQPHYISSYPETVWKPYPSAQSGNLSELLCLPAELKSGTECSIIRFKET